MSEDWKNRVALWKMKKRLRALKFADRVQMIRKLLKLIVETLDGMEAEAARECP